MAVRGQCNDRQFRTDRGVPAAVQRVAKRTDHRSAESWTRRTDLTTAVCDSWDCTRSCKNGRSRNGKSRMATPLAFVATPCSLLPEPDPPSLPAPKVRLQAWTVGLNLLDVL